MNFLCGLLCLLCLLPLRFRFCIGYQKAKEGWLCLNLFCGICFLLCLLQFWIGFEMDNIPLVVADYVGKKYPHATIHTIQNCVYMVGLGIVTIYIVTATAQEKIVDIQVD